VINVFEPTFNLRELDAISQVFESKWTGSGPLVKKFEILFAEKLGVDAEQIICTTSATEALFQISELENWKTNDEILIPTISFIAAATSVLNAGGKIKFIDVDQHSLNPTIEQLDNSLSANVKALILNHYGGMQNNIMAIVNWCKKNNIMLIEDSACAINSKINNKYLGTFGDYGVWSLDSMKLLSAGDGGIIFSKSREKADLLRRNLYLGLLGENTGLGSSKDKNRWWEYNISGPFRRAIMNDITASIALIQLTKLDELVSKRNTLLHKYIENLSGIGDLSFDKSIGEHRSPYFFWIQTEYRDQLAEYLLENNIYTTFRYFPLHKVPFFKSKDFLPNSEIAAKKTLLLPLHANLKEAEILKIIDSIQNFYSDYKVIKI
jgi:aminotransferase